VVAEVALDLGDELAVVGAALVEPEDAGVPVRRARVTASFTQSWIGMSLALAHAPDVAGLDLVLMSTVPSGVDHAHRAVAGISKVLSCEPYSSAFWPSGRRWAPSPSSPGRARRGPAVVDDRLVDRA
jgi:hypothetical protein